MLNLGSRSSWQIAFSASVAATTETGIRVQFLLAKIIELILDTPTGKKIDEGQYASIVKALQTLLVPKFK